MKMCIKHAISLLNRLVKKTDIIIFNSFPDYSDNALAVYNYILKNREDIRKKYQIVWTYSYTYDNNFENPIKKKSFKGILYFFRAKYVFCTHNYFEDVHSPNTQKVINLWHGNGYKRIPDDEKKYIGEYTLSTSDVYSKIQKEELGIQKVLALGLPRNDELFMDEVFPKTLLDLTIYKKIILWMPTYRKAKFNHAGINGNPDSFGISNLYDENYCNKLNDFLKDNNCCLILKPHPMEDLTILKEMSNIRIITNDLLEEYNVTLYTLIAKSSVLLSDYSSVMVDYLLLNRPIGVVAGDIQAYKESRGFVFDPIDDYLPGPVITNEEQFQNFLFSIVTGSDEYREKRMALRKKFHKYVDGKSSERVCEYFFNSSCEN